MAKMLSFLHFLGHTRIVVQIKLKTERYLVFLDFRNLQQHGSEIAIRQVRGLVIRRIKAVIELNQGNNYKRIIID